MFLFRWIIFSNNLYEILNTSLINYHPSFAKLFLHVYTYAIEFNNLSSYILPYLLFSLPFQIHLTINQKVFNTLSSPDIKIIIDKLRSLFHKFRKQSNPFLVFQFISKNHFPPPRFIHPSTCSNKTIPPLHTHHRGSTPRQLCHAPFNSLRSNSPFCTIGKVTHRPISPCKFIDRRDNLRANHPHEHTAQTKREPGRQSSLVGGNVLDIGKVARDILPLHERPIHDSPCSLPSTLALPSLLEQGCGHEFPREARPSRNKKAVSEGKWQRRVGGGLKGRDAVRCIAIKRYDRGTPSSGEDSSWISTRWRRGGGGWEGWWWAWRDRIYDCWLIRGSVFAATCYATRRRKGQLGLFPFLSREGSNFVFKLLRFFSFLFFSFNFQIERRNIG